MGHLAAAGAGHDPTTSSLYSGGLALGFAFVQSVPPAPQSMEVPVTRPGDGAVTVRVLVKEWVPPPPPQSSSPGSQIGGAALAEPAPIPATAAETSVNTKTIQRRFIREAP